MNSSLRDVPWSGDLADRISAHEQSMCRTFSLVPSENILSPLAKAVLASDAYSRYYFEDDRLWGQWAFHGGKEIGNIQESIVVPSLKRLTGARFVNVRGVSGLSNMILALSAYCKNGDTVFVLPPSLGGHASTAHVAERLGLRVRFLPQCGDFDIDVTQFVDELATSDAALVYIDQGNVLFPLDVQGLRGCMTDAASAASLHVDTSHINGLVFGGVLSNPLDCGADSFGGSLHKTFPGPHKAFIATNSERLMHSVQNVAAHLVSHHHGAEVLALAVTLLEFENCDGALYARQIVQNAQAFAAELHTAGFCVAGATRGYTQTHQVWIANNDRLRGNDASDRLCKAGLLVNSFSSLPVFPQGGIRVGLNEVTKLGVGEREARVLAGLFVAAVLGEEPDTVRSRVTILRDEFTKTKYCLDLGADDVQTALRRIVSK